MENVQILQDYNSYDQHDHATWTQLCNSLYLLHRDKIAKEYLEGLDKLKLGAEKIVKINEVSDRLEKISGWTLVPVQGLLPGKDFFALLIQQKYPITIYIRKPWEIDFSEQPDIFHDVFGHLPLLANYKFVKFLSAFSKIAFKYADNEKAIDMLGRLYWFTYEMGLIYEDGEAKPYGGAIITSADETANFRQQNVPKYPFNLDHIFNTPFNSFKLQKEYFIIHSFDDLFNSVENMERKLNDYIQAVDQVTLITE